MSFTFEVKVAPSAGRQQWKIDKSGMLKCYLKSPPEKGLANKELIGLIAKTLRVPKETVQIISGATSRKKLVKIAGAMTFDQLCAQLGIERQQKIFE